MLSNTLFRVPRAPGLHILHARGGNGAARELTSSRLCLTAGETATYARDGEETVVVLQQGSGTFATTARSWDVSRKGVFVERATALLLPPGVPLTVTATGDLEAVLVSAPSADAGAPALVSPGEVTVNARGRGTYAREVHDIFVRDPYARRLMVGETFNPPGHWSSFHPTSTMAGTGNRSSKRCICLDSIRRTGSVIRCSTPKMVNPSRTRSATATPSCCRTGTTRYRPLPATRFTTSG